MAHQDSSKVVLLSWRWQHCSPGENGVRYLSSIVAQEHKFALHANKLRQQYKHAAHVHVADLLRDNAPEAALHATRECASHLVNNVQKVHLQETINVTSCSMHSFTQIYITMHAL
jgi:short-subunit dehydrogenase